MAVERPLLIIVLIVVSTATQAMGLEVEVSSSDGQASTQMSTSYETTINDFVIHDMKLNPQDGDISNHQYGTGGFAKSISSIDSTGNRVQSYASVTSSGSATTEYWSEFQKSRTSEGHAQTQEWLIIHNAKSISAGSKAYNPDGSNNAESSVSINSGIVSPTTLAGLDYWSKAYIDSIGLHSEQQACSGRGNKDAPLNEVTPSGSPSVPSLANGASGDNVIFSEVAINGAEKSISNLDVKDAGITSYFGSTYDDSGEWVGVYSDISINKAKSIVGYIIAENSAGCKAKVSESIYSPTSQVSLNDYYSSSSSNKDNVNANVKAGYVSSIGAKGKIKVDSNSENKEGDKTSTSINVEEGKISDLINHAEANVNRAYGSLAASSAYGKIAEVTSHAENKELSKQYTYWGEIEIPRLKSIVLEKTSDYNGGSADFVVMKKNNDPFDYITVTPSASSNDLNIDSNAGVVKTVLILDPFRKCFMDNFGGDYFKTIGKKLEDKGYAITYYANAGVSKDSIENQLDDYTISMVRTHGLTNGQGLLFSKDSDIRANNGNNFVRTDEIKCSNKNDMIILDACYSFDLNFGGKTRPLCDVVKNAIVSGGHTGSVNVLKDSWFIARFFDRLCAGDTVSSANQADPIIVGIPFYQKQQLLLSGDQNYKLSAGSSLVGGA